ncbi:GNAT family N-acetyltransferase [Paenibacillus paeoniae]|uniref:GNAT family N-acetyltransferase n=1 Tax=Paenibacillus paeoniae TaxID=2292705 RepID=A0A371PKJ3_9BACL|nr:GNAT family N-acetyltransferase [Paenibacillus paeoniae]REK76718.1 GNAT family N-acetyltransferase [Paenibacillus paeoniae]
MKFRKAERADVREIVRMLADDEWGSKRERYEDPLPEAYYEAFAEMEAQGGNQIVLAVEEDAIIGCLQLVIIPGLGRLGMRRAIIEAVRVDRVYRGRGIGQALMREAIDIARSEKCQLVQLTTDKSRSDAHRFYHRLGFEASHEGMKLFL